MVLWLFMFVKSGSVSHGSALCISLTVSVVASVAICSDSRGTEMTLSLSWTRVESPTLAVVATQLPRPTKPKAELTRGNYDRGFVPKLEGSAHHA